MRKAERLSLPAFTSSTMGRTLCGFVVRALSFVDRIVVFDDGSLGADS